MFSIRRLIHNPAIPREYHSNFLHLYLDIGWFGILSGSAVNFLNVFAARLGATGFQIGLLGAVTAMVNLVFTIPAGHWLEQRQIGKSVFWTSIVYRLGFLLWIPLPLLFNNQGQIWALIGITLLMGVPLTALTVGFNTMFAAAVPLEWRAYVVGLRNVVLSSTFILTSLGSGYLLHHMPFPVGYQIVFGIGFFSALMSSLHLFFIKPLNAPITATPQPFSNTNKLVTRHNWRRSLRADLWKTPFRKVLLVILGFHLTQYLALPLFPLYFVNQLKLTDEKIGLGTALFYLTVLIGSMQLNRIVKKIGHHKVTGWSVAGMSLYPLLMAFSLNEYHYYFISFIGGLVWAMVSGAYLNYLLENIPESDRPAHLAWYNIILNACILIGSTAGPFLAGHIGLSLALVIFSLLRFISGLVILRWG